MKRSNRIIALALTALFVLSMLTAAACGPNKNPAGSTPKPGGQSSNGDPGQVRKETPDPMKDSQLLVTIELNGEGIKLTAGEANKLNKVSVDSLGNAADTTRKEKYIGVTVGELLNMLGLKPEQLSAVSVRDVNGNVTDITESEKPEAAVGCVVCWASSGTDTLRADAYFVVNDTNGDRVKVISGLDTLIIKTQD